MFTLQIIVAILLFLDIIGYISRATRNQSKGFSSVGLLIGIVLRGLGIYFILT